MLRKGDPLSFERRREEKSGPPTAAYNFNPTCKRRPASCLAKSFRMQSPTTSAHVRPQLGAPAATWQFRPTVAHNLQTRRPRYLAGTLHTKRFTFVVGVLPEHLTSINSQPVAPQNKSQRPAVYRHPPRATRIGQLTSCTDAGGAPESSSSFPSASHLAIHIG